MAPAIVHFLVGASVLLALAAPAALRSRRVRGSAVLLVAAGGIWGIAPDVHHVAPIYRRRLLAAHASPWTDAFAFHYTLDLAPIRTLSTTSTFAAVLLFCVFGALFAVAARIGDRHADRSASVGPGSVAGAAATAVAATAVLGGAAHTAGYLDTLGALGAVVGRQSPLTGWAVAAGPATAAAVGFGLLVELGPGSRYLPPGRAALAGLTLGALAWLVAVLALPVLLLRTFGRPPSLTHADPAGLVGFTLAGGVLAATYAAVARQAGRGSDGTSGRVGSPR